MNEWKIIHFIYSKLRQYMLISEFYTWALKGVDTIVQDTLEEKA